MKYWIVFWRVPVDLDRRTTGMALAYANSASEARRMVRNAVGPGSADTMIPTSVELMTEGSIVDWSISSLELNEAREKGISILEYGT